MFIIDLTGMKIEISDLDGAIEMAKGFIAYKRQEEDAGLQQFEKNRQTYWNDVLEKLLRLRENNSDQK